MYKVSRKRYLPNEKGTCISWYERYWNDLFIPTVTRHRKRLFEKGKINKIHYFYYCNFGNIIEVFICTAIFVVVVISAGPANDILEFWPALTTVSSIFVSLAFETLSAVMYRMPMKQKSSLRPILTQTRWLPVSVESWWALESCIFL